VCVCVCWLVPHSFLPLFLSPVHTHAHTHTHTHTHMTPAGPPASSATTSPVQVRVLSTGDVGGDGEEDEWLPAAAATGAACATDAAALRSSHSLHKRSARSFHCLVLYASRDLYSSHCMHINCFVAFRAAIWTQSLRSSCKNPRSVNSTYQPAAAHIACQLGLGLGLGLGSHSSSHAPLLLATLLSHNIPLPRVH
jgi:hypothetical protein